MGWPDNCLYWQAISSLIAVQYHCQPLIMAGTALSDTLTPQWCVRVCVSLCVFEHLFACVHLGLQIILMFIMYFFVYVYIYVHCRDNME